MDWRLVLVQCWWSNILFYSSWLCCLRSLVILGTAGGNKSWVNTVENLTLLDGFFGVAPEMIYSLDFRGVRFLLAELAFKAARVPWCEKKSFFLNMLTGWLIATGSWTSEDSLLCYITFSAEHACWKNAVASSNTWLSCRGMVTVVSPLATSSTGSVVTFTSFWGYKRAYSISLDSLFTLFSVS